ncbi:MAG: SURF1 family protein [Brevundimonas sp.]
MARAAVRPRMLALLVLLLGAAFVCGRLGAWQLDRAQIRGAGAQERHVAEQLAAAPVPILDVLGPQTAFEGADVGRKVSVTGEYDAEDQLVVPDRAHAGVTGYLVLTPLRTDVGVLPVVRGWARSVADVGAPPEGDVQVVGFLQASEAAGAGIADGQTSAISSAELVGAWGGPIWTGYLVLQSSDPAQSDDLAVLDIPRKPGEGLNLQNLAYAAQWWIFGSFAVLLWLRLVRDEARGDRGAEPDAGPRDDSRADRPGDAEVPAVD